MCQFKNIDHMPCHILKLKKNQKVVLIRNVNPVQGLCIGTHVRIKRLGGLVIEAEIITGSNIGDTVFIPRITFILTMTRWPFKMKCTQFPIKICAAYNIHGINQDEEHED